MLEVEGASEKKKRLESLGKEIIKKDKINILIKIEFFYMGGIVKWYGISNKVTF